MLIEQFICRSDNYGVLIHDEQTGLTASIDAPDATAILNALKRRNWSLDVILITHHHLDHVEGIEQLKQAFNVNVIGPKAEQDRIQHLNQSVSGGDEFNFGSQKISVIATPGHTSGEISYYLPNSACVFTGDTLFSLGCGRLFEGTAQTMLESLTKLRALPDETQIYCGHEYTKNNAEFALTIEPDNQQLTLRAQQVFELCKNNQMTLPSSIGLEKATNPFLRWDQLSVRQNLAMEKADDVAVFAEIRKRKDHF